MILQEWCIVQPYKAGDDIVANAGNMAWSSDLSTWKQAGKELTDDSYLPQLVDAMQEQTAAEFKNLTKTTGFKTISGFESVENLYHRELDKAVIKICTGTFSQDKVVRDTVKDLSQSGLRSIDYESGRSMQVGTAVRLALRTGCHQLSLKVQDNNILNTGVNLVHVKAHNGARNTGTGHANHEEWQGKVYYIKPGVDYTEESKRIGQDSITDLWEATGYSIDGAHENDPLGLNGYNCRHMYFAFFEGASILHKAAPQPGPFTVDGKEYDYYQMTKKLRSMERNVRKLKREREALKSLGQDTTELDAKIKQKTREYKGFCKSCNVPVTTSNLRYEGKTSDLQKTESWKMYQSLVKSGSSDIMSTGERAIGNDNFRISQSKFLKAEYKDITELKHSLSNRDVRMWYKEKDKHIIENLDNNLTLEEKARYACEQRNTYRTQARDLMRDQSERKRLDEEAPNRTFDQILEDKMVRKNMSKEKAMEDIIKTSGKTNKKVDTSLGLGD